MKKPTKREIKFATIMSSITTFFVTFVVVFVNIGFSDKFIFIWMRSWFIAFVLVGLSILFVAPQIQKHLNK